MQELELLCSMVMEIARETGEFILGERKRLSSPGFEAKGKQNFVTHVDTGSEKMLVGGLKELLPEAGFIAEEGTAGQSGEDYQWIIDPLDGTTNFIHGLPPYAISIALAHEGKIVLGIIYELGYREFFYAWKGGKAYKDGKEIRVSKTPDVNSSLIATGFPYTYFDRLDPFMVSMRYFMQNSHGLRRLGPGPHVAHAHAAVRRCQCAHASGLAQQAATTVLQGAGASIHVLSNPMQRLVRDINVSASHQLHEFDEVAEQYGRTLFGLEPNSVMR